MAFVHQGDRIFPGDTEMARRMRAFDWKHHELGPPERWPQNLKTSVRITLTSRQMMFVWWGPRLINLYNDAYAKFLFTKHPRALGQPAATVWSEIWDQIGPRAEFAMHQESGTYDEALPLIVERRGHPEEIFCTFSYSPIPDDDGGFGGILCPLSEDTARIVGERQLAVLRDLAARCGDARTWQDACCLAAGALATNPANLPFALIYVVDPETRSAVLSGSAVIERATALAPETIALEDESIWPIGEAVRTRSVVPVSIRPPLGPVAQALVLPLPPSGSTGKGGALVAGLNPLRAFDDGYQRFLGLVASGIAAAITNGEAYEQERKRAEALAEIDRVKTTFFSNVSHEFRTPLTLMFAPLEELRRERLPDVLREPLDIAHRNAVRLLKLVNTLLDFARIEAARTHPIRTPTDLAQLTADLASAFRSVIERAGMWLLIECPSLPEPVSVDREMWEKIVLNLLSNAFKFTFAGGIAVSLQWRGDHVELTVRDTGVGIPEEELAHVFDRFHRVPNVRARTFEGTGIGLALVKELVTLHGGSARARSVVGQGSAFTITIPTGGVPPTHPRERAAPPLVSTALGPTAYVEEAMQWLPDERLKETEATPGTPRVLLADDNADMRDYLRRVLSQRWRVDAVADGAAALEAARRTPPDLVVTDVMMPQLDGIELLHALRAEPSLSTVPVILLTARIGDAPRMAGFEAGATDYLAKPFSAAELVAIVSARLEAARLNREAVGREQTLRRAILDGMADTFYAIDAEWRLTDFNRHAEVQLRLLGKDPDSLIGRRVWDEFDNPPVEEVFRRVMRERVPVTHEHYYPPLGEWVENRIYPTPDGGLSVFQRYITERKRAEEELRRGTGYLADSQQLSHTGSWAFDPTTRAIFWSSEHYRIFGLDPDGSPPTYEEILAQVHADDRLRLEQAFAEAVAARGDYEIDVRVIRPDGTTRYIRSLGRPVVDVAGTLTEYVGTTIDMTERHVADEALYTAQAELAQMARLTTMGELAASLAHEINQPLTAIVTNGGASLGFLDRASPEIGKAADAIRAVIENAERAGQVIAAARGFLRKSSGALTAVDMNAVIRDVLVVVTPEIRRQDVVLRTKLFDDVPAVMAVAVQMQQVVLNLVMNAVEAMAAVTERRRELVVRCLRDEVEEHDVVCVEVEDSGIGVAPAELHRVFDAFYTTKPDGLGMGLSISRSIVQTHGGRLWATLHASGGMTFQFTIPAAGPSGS